MSFDVPEIEDPSIVTGGASEVRTAGENVQQKMRDTANAWQPISGQYHAPEDGQVHRAMRTPEEMADEIMKSAGRLPTVWIPTRTNWGRSGRERLTSKTRSRDTKKRRRSRTPLTLLLRPRLPRGS